MNFIQVVKQMFCHHKFEEEMLTVTYTYSDGTKFEKMLVVQFCPKCGYQGFKR